MSSLSQKHSGALNHLEGDLFLFGSNPLEVSSAGFNLKGARPHQTKLHYSCTWFIGFATNILKTLLAQYDLIVCQKAGIFPSNISILSI